MFDDNEVVFSKKSYKIDDRKLNFYGKTFPVIYLEGLFEGDDSEDYYNFLKVSSVKIESFVDSVKVVIKYSDGREEIKTYSNDNMGFIDPYIKEVYLQGGSFNV